MEKNNKLITICIATAVILVAGIYFWPNVVGILNNVGDKGSVTFINPNNQEEVEVVFGEDDAVFTGLGYTQVLLQHATSASGARFVDEERGLELWNRGDDVTISVEGEQVFTGNTEGQTDSEKLYGTWVWQATTLDNVITEPNNSDAFKLTFEDSTVRGTTDCNGFGGDYTTGSDDSLTFGPLAATLMYCEGSQEQEYIGAISKVQSYYFTGSGALVLELSDGGTMLFSK